MAENVITQKMKRREQRYRQDKPFPVFENRSLINTDDGLATGYSMLAATTFVLKRNPQKLIVASPGATHEAYKLIASEQRINQIVILISDCKPLFHSHPIMMNFPKSQMTMC
jgi:predicted phosphoribosyltransferase